MTLSDPQAPSLPAMIGCAACEGRGRCVDESFCDRCGGEGSLPGSASVAASLADPFPHHVGEVEALRTFLRLTRGRRDAFTAIAREHVLRALEIALAQHGGSRT